MGAIHGGGYRACPPSGAHHNNTASNPSSMAHAKQHNPHTIMPHATAPHVRQRFLFQVTKRRLPSHRTAPLCSRLPSGPINRNHRTTQHGGPVTSQPPQPPARQCHAMGAIHGGGYRHVLDSAMPCHRTAPLSPQPPPSWTVPQLAN